MRISFKPGGFFAWHKTVKNRPLVWAVFFLFLCALWFVFSLVVRELFTGAAGQPLHPERYSGLFLIVLLLGLLYPLFTFWRTDIQDLDADEAVGEQNYADCFFIRHIARVVLGLFVLVGCAYVLFEYLGKA